MSFINLKYLIKIDRGIDLPIKSGTGSSIDDPIVIERSEDNNCVSVEYALLDYIGDTRGIKWELLNQRLVSHNRMRIDHLEIETKEFSEQGLITKIENYYFDITDCFGNTDTAEFNRGETL